MIRGTTRGTAGGLAVIAVLALGISLLVSWKRRSATRQLRGLIAAEIDRGSLVGLGRAQVIGRRVVLAGGDDAESPALVAFASALLATEFGQGTINEVEFAAARAEEGLGDRPAPAASMAARALVALRKGQRARALELATAAASGTGGRHTAHCALGRVRAAGGDLVGASHAFESAMVAAPSFLPAKLAWAEVRLDMGDAAAAQAVLVPIVARAPEDVRARLLLEEAWQMLAATSGAMRPVDAALESVCSQNGALAPYVVAGCALAWSEHARGQGDRLRAEAEAQAAGRSVPDEPRMLARAAQLLAQQGLVDRAEKLLERATRLAAPEMPALTWARLAVTLGHGRAATAPPGLRPTNGITRVLAARAAFAAGGAGSLAAVLDRYGAQTLENDVDLRLLARLAAPGAAPKVEGAPPPGKPPAAAAYVEGMRARLAGDSMSAALHLSHALGGHADACRAAGEYVAVLGALKRRADGASFNSLRAENQACVNLPP